MKSILLFCLACFVLSVSDDEKGPAYNPKHPESELFCTHLAVWQGDMWLDDVASEGEVPGGPSDCVDTLLWNNVTEKYYDRCCFVRFQLNGDMHQGCLGLSEEQYLDTSETIRRMERGDKEIWTTRGANSKIYQLDCNSSFLKILSFASILLALIF